MGQRLFRNRTGRAGGQRTLIVENEGRAKEEIAAGATGTILAHGALTINNACERESAVRFAIEIGDTEKHRLEYNFNQLLGSLVIKVNEKAVKKSRAPGQ